MKIFRTILDWITLRPVRKLISEAINAYLALEDREAMIDEIGCGTEPRARKSDRNQSHE